MLLRFIIFCTKMLIIFSLTGLIAGAYIIYYFSKDLPDYSQLKQYYPPSVTRMYSSDGKLMEEYAKEHRVFVPINSIPKFLIEAFIAAEDKNFYHHSGIDVSSIVRAAITNISHIMNKRRMEGGSTITQQVVKNFLLTSERSIERKIKEAILSYRVSQIFTKDEILELYLNQIYLGKSAYGVAAAALNYFNKSIEELTLNESAVLASLPKAPSKFNPQRNPKRAFIRKNYVLGRMYEDGYITKEEAKKAVNEPIKLAKMDKVQTLNANYYAAKVREEVIGLFGEEYFYNAGLTIITCADSELQQAAVDALHFGIKKYDMKRGYRGVVTNINLQNWHDDLRALVRPVGLKNYELSVVLNVSKNQVKVGLKNGKVTNIFLKDMKWAATNLQSATKILKIGDVIMLEKKGDNYYLQQIPDVNGGIIIIENETGRVLASEGGYDYNMSKFDRTTQAKRQPGSLIKPFVYLAALENGAKTNDIFEDAPIAIDQGVGLPLWEPKNYERNFLGAITLRKGLEKSRNTVTVRVGQFVGTPKVAEVIKRFSINDNPPFLHSIVLGAIETTLMRMTMAYGIIANGGKKLEPQYIELIKDRKGNVIYKRDYTDCSGCRVAANIEDINMVPAPKVKQIQGKIITDDASNYQLTSLLMGSVQRGTSRGAKHLKHIIAGKTGTTNDVKDAWFMGFTPKIVVGTYIGYDNPRSLGKKVSGASIALPVFVHFMKNGYKNMPSIDFLVPDSVELASIDYETGKLSVEQGAIIEAFKKNYFNDSFLNPVFRNIIPQAPRDNGYDPFSKIQNYDQSQELY